MVELAAVVVGDDQVDSNDRFDELEEWLDVEVEAENALGYPWSPPEIRAQLVATDQS